MEKAEKDLVWFVLLAYMISWILWLPPVLMSLDILHFRSFFEFWCKLGTFGPLAASLIMTAVYSGRNGVIVLFKRLFYLRFKAIWHAYAFLLMPCILLVSYWAAQILYGLEFKSLLLPFILPHIWPIIPILLIFIFLQGPFGEELGWRGYALDRLLQKLNPLTSSIILGIVWTFWHLPLYLIEGTTQYSLVQAFGIWIGFVGFFVYTVLLSILLTFLYMNTDGSIGSVIMFHATANFSHGLITILITPLGGACILMTMFIVCLIFLMLKRNVFFNVQLFEMKEKECI
ncbi:CAAX amino terminal protease self- immunity [Clostridium homopropionicum DSM 5847]|uniref:CAAX amino terminal protease self-immunity n=1 Tax=Clostridium homopropionicum DSM 5847 TaxID=1121318 RepID=A0A0L6Z8L2_9CLOT|nr:CPBP family intramembrane glutamic endopeptidase [Clostridium homopropionicum]KOA19307.1 CAAX amino terminal protease self- immunity [Clostridium homopropionicum DSM 5847]SFG20565.1 CAAX protease self-immunity [Clostridium homopropionicum]